MMTLTAADELICHSLRTLELTGRERLRPWLDRLRKWDSDEALRARAQALPDAPGPISHETGFRPRIRSDFLHGGVEFDLCGLIPSLGRAPMVATGFGRIRFDPVPGFIAE